MQKMNNEKNYFYSRRPYVKKKNEKNYLYSIGPYAKKEQ